MWVPLTAVNEANMTRVVLMLTTPGMGIAQSLYSVLSGGVEIIVK